MGWKTVFGIGTLLLSLSFGHSAVAQDAHTVVSRAFNDCISWVESTGKTSFSPIFQEAHQADIPGGRITFLLNTHLPVRVETKALSLRTMESDVLDLSCLIRWIDPADPFFPYKFPIPDHKIDLNQIKADEQDNISSAITKLQTAQGLDPAFVEVPAEKALVSYGSSSLFITCRKDSMQELHFMPEGASSRYPEPQIRVTEWTFYSGLPDGITAQCP